MWHARLREDNFSAPLHREILRFYKDDTFSCEKTIVWSRRIWFARGIIDTNRSFYSTIMKQRAKQRLGYANAVLGSVTNQRDRLISKELDPSSAFLPRPRFFLASWNLLDTFCLPLYRYFSLFPILYPPTLSDRIHTAECTLQKSKPFWCS